MNTRIARMLAGAVSGLVATGPMTLLMTSFSRRGFRHSINPLPPRQITSNLLDSAGLDDVISQESEEVLTMVNHFAYGASMGGVYGLVAGRQAPGNGIPVGVAFGVGVWAASYLGWLPAAGLYRSAIDDSRERNLLMLAAHVVWGGSLGYLTEVLHRRLERESQIADGPNRQRSAQELQTAAHVPADY